jgi:hypothetical protein
MRLLLLEIVKMYGLDAKVWENGMFRDPTLQEFLERLRYLSSDDMRASCRGRDGLVREMLHK